MLFAHAVKLLALVGDTCSEPKRVSGFQHYIYIYIYIDNGLVELPGGVCRYMVYTSAPQEACG